MQAVTSTGTGRAAEARFRLLFDEHLELLLGYALRRVGSPEDAADVVADTMMVAWRRLDDVPADAETKLWLYGVARRVLANHRRGEARRHSLGDRLREGLQSTSPDHAGSVDSAVAVRAALASLGAEDRELIQLTAWEGLEPRDVAVVLGVPAQTVRTRLHRARARLRRAIGDVSGDGGHVRDGGRTLVLEEER